MLRIINVLACDLASTCVSWPPKDAPSAWAELAKNFAKLQGNGRGQTGAFAPWPVRMPVCVLLGWGWVRGVGGTCPGGNPLKSGASWALSSRSIGGCSWDGLPALLFALPAPLQCQLESQVAPPSQGEVTAGASRWLEKGARDNCGRSEASPAPPVPFPGTISTGACPCRNIGLAGSTGEEMAESER